MLLKLMAYVWQKKSILKQNKRGNNKLKNIYTFKKKMKGGHHLNFTQYLKFLHKI